MSADTAREAPESAGGEAVRDRRSRVLWALVVATLTLPFIGWGLPYATAPDRTKSLAVDEIVPLGPLADMSNMFIEEKPDWHLGYPWWHYAVTAGAQAPYLGYLKVTGGLKKPTGQFPFGLDDPVRSLIILTVIGRLVSVAMAIGIAWATLVWVGLLFGRRAAHCATLFLVLTQLFVYFGRTGNVDLPALFWSSIGLVFYARAVTEGLTTRRVVGLGIFAGLAMATKDQAVVVFLPLAVTMLRRRAFVSRGLSWQVAAPAFGLLSSIVAYLFATGMLFNPTRHIEHVKALFFNPDRVTAASVYWPAAPMTLEGRSALVWDYVSGFAAMATPPLLILALLGTFLSRGRGFGRRTLWVPFFLLFILLIWPAGAIARRYFLPLLPFAAAFGGATVSWFFEHGRARLAWACTIATALFQGAIVVDMTYSQTRETRDQAAEWLRINTTPGDYIEYFGHEQKLPPMDADIFSRRIADRIVWEGDRDHGPRIMSYLKSGGQPPLIFECPDWTSHPGWERSADCPPEVFDGLKDGSLGYREVKSFPTPRLLSGIFERPRLDNSAISPPVRIFAREDVAVRLWAKRK